MKNILLLGIACIAVAGCGVVPPQVQYTEYKPSVPAEPGFAFRIRRSVLLVSYDGKANAFKVQPSPYEFDRNGNYLPLYTIRGLDDLMATTQLKVTYLDNTKLPDQITVTTKDNVADTISKIGSTVSALVPFVAGAVAEAGPAKAAIVFHDTVLDPQDAAGDKWLPDSANNGYCMRLQQVTTDPAVSIPDYLASRGTGKIKDFPVSTCASAVVEIATCGAGGVSPDIVSSQRVMYAAAGLVTPMAFPSSGTMKMGSTCGAVVTEADKEDRRDLMTYLQGLITQVNNVKAAAKKKQ